MQTLSKDAEDRVVSAVKRAVAMVDDQHADPTDALETIARTEKWGRDMVSFACHAYNTGRQTAQRESSSSIVEKLASFPLADAGAIHKRMWPEQSTAKAADDPGMAPDDFLRLRARDSGLIQLKAASSEKTANTKICEPAAPTFCAVHTEYRRLKRAAEDARIAAGAAYRRLLDNLDNVATYFRKSAGERLPFGEVETCTAAYHGAAGQGLMDWVYNRMNLKEARAKTAKFAAAVRYLATEEPYPTIRECLKTAAAVSTLRSSEAAAREALEQHVRGELAPFVAPGQTKVAWDTLAGTTSTTTYADASLRTFLPLQAAPVQIKEAAAAPSAAAPWSLLAAAEVPAGEKRAGPFDATGGILSVLGGKELLENAIGDDTGGKINKKVMDLEDPAHETQLNQIRAQAMLTDLMNNDDVIGGYAPEQVARAYSDISNMAPRAAQHPLAVRSLLRRSLQGHLEPFEANQMAQLEGEVLKSTPPLSDPTEKKDGPKPLF